MKTINKIVRCIKFLQILLLTTVLFSTCTFAQSTKWTEKKLTEYWKSNPADEIEGIYLRRFKNQIILRNRVNDAVNQIVEGKYFIVKQGDRYILSSFDGDFYGTLSRVYNSNNYFLAINSNQWIEDINSTIKMTLTHENHTNLIIDEYRLILDDDEYMLINDVFTVVWKPEVKIKNDQIASGTGFAISESGIIATNFHVIENAKTIKVKGINSDFSKSFTAKILISDKINDLALIQIDDRNFTSLSSLPYTLKKELTNVGESIFVLGYPLRASMGDEIKLTNGIISSRTGFQGDITSYQISAPVQPGSSGGPLFDSQGNLIGIVNSKLRGAENATYAIKANYLFNLIELLSVQPKLQSVNTLKGKSLPAQVEISKQFVYIIETE